MTDKDNYSQIVMHHPAKIQHKYFKKCCLVQIIRTEILHIKFCSTWFSII